MKKLYAFFLIFSLSVYADNIKTDSIYNLNSKWTNQDGKIIELKDFRGQAVIMAMVYLSCSYLCPTVINEVQNIESKLDPAIKDKVKIILVSFDPVRDTVAKMQEYAKKRKLDLKHWMIITQKDESNIRELAATLGFKYEKLEDGEFAHSFIIAALDKEGVIVAKVEAANTDHKTLLDALKTMK